VESKTVKMVVKDLLSADNQRRRVGLACVLSENGSEFNDLVAKYRKVTSFSSH